jgi:hypothetical protein
VPDIDEIQKDCLICCEPCKRGDNVHPICFTEMHKGLEKLSIINAKMQIEAEKVFKQA